nr:HIRAN domain-containing protein [uncultured Butyrivibrio sp.]
MKDVFFTLAGTKNYYGCDFLEPGMKVKIIKEPDNEYDREAIRVELRGLGKIGYVANSPYTVIGESMSAGRIYDRIKDEADAEVVYVTYKGTICELSDEVGTK